MDANVFPLGSIGMTPFARAARLAQGVASLAALFLLALPSASAGPGSGPPPFAFVAGKHLVAGAPSKEFASEVLARAEALRDSIAVDWLGGELPAGAATAIIHVDLDDQRDEGLTLLAGRNSDHGPRMWLRTSRERAVGSTLAHEMAHVVLSARFPDGMPAWANEGVASLYDDASRHRTRQAILKDIARRGDWPSLADTLADRTIRPTDETSYAIAVSLTQFFLARGTRTQFIEFIDDGRQNKWQSALDRHYAIGSIAELQRDWQTWVVRTSAAAP